MDERSGSLSIGEGACLGCRRKSYLGFYVSLTSSLFLELPSMGAYGDQGWSAPLLCPMSPLLIHTMTMSLFFGCGIKLIKIKGKERLVLPCAAMAHKNKFRSSG